ncbi:DUF6155 family protein [Hymenobacter antarcticus]|uniref:Uncharacterized protein n=1 Tax=Hymenobacter antarcticus TaxID=486270 RepID=A0ABP7PGA2_9BACT
MGLTELKKELQKLDQDKLIALITDLYKKIPAAKEFLDFYVSPNEQALFEEYREKVLRAFFPKRGMRLKLREGKQAISEFKKLGTSPELLAELMLFYVETGVQFSREFGDISAEFCASLQGLYEQALGLMKESGLLGKVAGRARQVVIDTGGSGWGFHDELHGLYQQFYKA